MAKIDKTILFTQSVKAGLLYALIGVIWWLIVYTIEVEWFFHWVYYIVTLLIFFVYFILAGKKYRGKLETGLGFGHAFLFVWITLVIYGLIIFAFQMLMIKVIDPTLTQELANGVAKATQKMAVVAGYEAELVEKARDKFFEKAMEEFSTLSLIKNFLITNVIYALGALFIGLVIKKQ